MSDNLIWSINHTIQSLESLKALLEGRRVLGSLPSEYPHQFGHSEWECERSPTGHCMYTTDWDSCIFCGDPEERK